MGAGDNQIIITGESSSSLFLPLLVNNSTSLSLSLSLSGLIYRPQLWLLHCRFSGGFDELTIDQDRISLYTFKTMSSRQVMREKRKK